VRPKAFIYVVSTHPCISISVLFAELKTCGGPPPLEINSGLLLAVTVEDMFLIIGGLLLAVTKRVNVV